MAVDTLRAHRGTGNSSGDVLAVAGSLPRIPAHVAAAAARAIAEGPRVAVEVEPVALELLEEIAIESRVAMQRLASGEAVTGSSSLRKIGEMARDALRLSRDTPASS